MTPDLTKEERQTLARIADEPFYWLRQVLPELKDSEDLFFDLLDQLKASWGEARKYRINLCFILELVETDPNKALYRVSEVAALQKHQNDSSSKLVFSIDLRGNVTNEIDMGSEIEPSSVTTLSQLRKAIVFWLGPDFEIICNGVLWNPKNKAQVLKEIKSKKRDLLLPMDDYRAVLTTHYEQYVRGEAGVLYWFTGKKNEVLQSSPERIFQKSLCTFLRTEVDCIADPEPMFKDFSRCDVRVFVDYDLYFIEIKWIGFCAVRQKDPPIISAEHPAEFIVDQAIAGAYQTKIYIEENNSAEYDNRIRMGIIVVYDAYCPPRTPINYPSDVKSFPLIDTMDFKLVTLAPSVKAKELASKALKKKTTGKARSTKK
jgi:hypothetical protein